MNQTESRLHALPSSSERLHALDAVRGFALLLGVAFHAAMSFLPGIPPGIWSMVDNSPSQFLGDAGFVTHIFRMSLFFFIAGFFGRLLYHKLGAGGFWKNRGLRIAVPLVAGWVILFPLIGLVWSLGIAKLFNGAPPAMPEMPKVPGAFPLTHLWFLYQLLMLYAAMTLLRAVFERIPDAPKQKLRAMVDSGLSAALRLNIGVFVFGIPVAAVLMSLPFWLYWTGIPTPDGSLYPQLPATVGFFTAFLIGWLVHRSSDALAIITKKWWMNLVFAAIATGWLLHTSHVTPFAAPGTTKMVYAYTFGVAVWAWVFGLTGAALRFLSNYSPVRRYVADASYWIYLAHLPVVAALAVWVGHWPLHWGIKYPFILVVSFAVLFLSYHFLVRPTFIGQLLNGRKYPRKAAAPAAESRPTADVSRDTVAVARLRGITKKYGNTTALANVDIELRRGELLAVLGPNGAGKTTAISLWLGLTEADSGEVTLLGGSPLEIERRRGLGVMMQDVEMYKELRVRELITLASSYYSQPLEVEETMRRAGITALADRPYGKLSGGQKRQAQFAVAICGRPRVLFLDEPTVGLDVQAREALWANVRQLLAEGCSIVLTTHYLEEAESLATRVAVLAKGRVIATGSVQDMRALVARRQISCESTLSVDEVRGWSGVTDVSRVHARLSIVASDAEAVVRRLLAEDPGLRRLEVREAGLAEAFTELTKEAA
jgi:ABC-type multidrug transport system ATPase subunit/peptidoglycan/LPS O-acetylase OafA/YrhL